MKTIIPYDRNRAKYTAALGVVDKPIDPANQTYDAAEWISFFCGGLSLQMKQAEYRVIQNLQLET